MKVEIWRGLGDRQGLEMQVRTEGKAESGMGQVSGEGSVRLEYGRVRDYLAGVE